MNIEPSLTGKTALVTGAGRMKGTGHSIALALAASGCDVVLNGSGSAQESWPETEKAAGWRGLDSVAGEIRALGRRALVAVADLRSSAHVDAMVEGAIAEFGRLDILVNNAAAPRGADRTEVTDLTDDAWREVLDVKLNGAFYCARAAAKRMVTQGAGGSIINISSIGGKLGGAKAAAYGAASAGLHALGASLARELGPHAITVNSLCVGMVDTSRIDDMRGSAAYRALIDQQIPLRRMGTAEEIAQVVVFLCGKSGAYITGQSINVDGGFVIH